MNFALQISTEVRSSGKTILLNSKGINYLDNLLKLWGKVGYEKFQGIETIQYRNENSVKISRRYSGGYVPTKGNKGQILV